MSADKPPSLGDLSIYRETVSQGSPTQDEVPVLLSDQNSARNRVSDVPEPPQLTITEVPSIQIEHRNTVSRQGSEFLEEQVLSSYSNVYQVQEVKSATDTVQENYEYRNESQARLNRQRSYLQSEDAIYSNEAIPDPAGEIQEDPYQEPSHDHRNSHGHHGRHSFNTNGRPRRISNSRPRRFSLRDRLPNIPTMPSSILRRLAVSQNTVLQQKLPAWHPIINCTFVGRLFLYISLILLILGMILFIFGSSIKELKFPYADACKSSRDYLKILRRSCIFCGGHNPSCSIEVRLEDDIKTPVYVYYELENFYQNHRRLVKSVDFYQLLGRIFTRNMEPIAPSLICLPLTNNTDGKIYFPCGSLANSMFSDSFHLKNDNGYTVPLKKNRISHPTVKKYKFANPSEVTPNNYNHKRSFYSNFAKPQDWSKEFWDEWWKNGGLENDDFVNWMQPSPFSTLRKLYAVIDSVPDCPKGVLCKGNYTMQIEYRFDVESFRGNKAFILATTSRYGGRNLFIPSFTFFMGVLFAFLGLQLSKLGELSDIKKDTSKSSIRKSTDNDSNARSHRPREIVRYNVEDIPDNDNDDDVTVVYTYKAENESEDEAYFDLPTDTETEFSTNTNSDEEGDEDAEWGEEGEGEDDGYSQASSYTSMISPTESLQSTSSRRDSVPSLTSIKSSVFFDAKEKAISSGSIADGKLGDEDDAKK